MNDYVMVIVEELRLRRQDGGASLIEYALLVGLIALVCIVGVAALGGKTGSTFNSMAKIY